MAEVKRRGGLDIYLDKHGLPNAPTKKPRNRKPKKQKPQGSNAAMGAVKLLNSVRPQVNAKHQSLKALQKVVKLPRMTDALALAVAMPHTEPPPRVVTGLSSSYTAVATIHNLVELNNTAATTGSVMDLYADGTGVVSVTRDPYHFLWYTRTSVGTNQTSYLFSNSVSGIGPNMAIESSISTSPFPMNFVLASGSPTSIVAPIWQNTPQFCFSDFGRTWCYVEPSDLIKISVYVNGTMSSVTCQINVYTWSPNGPVLDPLNSTNIANASVTDTVICNNVGSAQSPNFFGFDIAFATAISPASNTYITAKLIRNNSARTASGFTCIECALPLWQMASSIASVRMTGVSLLVSNKASALNAAGEVACLQTRSYSNMLDVFGSWAGAGLQQNPVALMGAYPDVATMPLATGAYGWMRPMRIEDLELQPYADIRGSTLEGLRLGSPTMAGGCLIVAYAAPFTSGASMANNFLIVATAAVEFETSSQICGQAVGRTSRSDVERAMMILRTVPQFSENPLHWAKILSAIRSGGKRALQFAPGILAALGMPAWSAAAAAVNTAAGL